ncbi:MAG: cytochrome c biogenesis protein CcsA [Bradyrhizobiaceae bacterium]|nr:cytochrome c biogenesis protein CcsA [Bradyrhizobiaceae bacterium]
MIEQLIVHLLLGLAVGTTVSYALAHRANGAHFIKLGRTLLTMLMFGLIACASMLIINIVQHQFQYTYVWNQSSREMPLHLLIASFYSGQEGSFLLWAMFVSIIAVFALPHARRFGYEPTAMTLFGGILCFLTLLLVAKNPFALYWESFAKNGLTAADLPANGKGMNPLLHNTWITIHPPILFAGFASMTVSFVFAVAGLIKKEYHRWIVIALPWTLFATAILGFGIMLGGFWAYETLGWGGFWAWDPVENSSLIPWLVSVALVHTMLVQKRTRGLVKTTVALAIAAFVFVLYSTFLTRSGVLGDTSVHSFVDPGAFAFWILLGFMIVFSGIGVTLLVMRAKDIDKAKDDFAPTTREFMLSIGSALVMASAVFVTVGTSWPVIMEIIGQPKVAVTTGFYNQIHSILVPLVLLVNGISLLVQWRGTTLRTFKKRTIIAAGISAVLTLPAIALGITNLGMIALTFGGWFALVVNAQMAWPVIRRSPTHAGAYISHTGIALLVFGVITSSQFSVIHHAVLVKGVPTAVGEYVLTYEGREQIEKQWKDREKYRYHVDVRKADQDPSDAVRLSATLYWSDYNQRQSAFLEPGIRWGIHNDLYLTPKATSEEDLFKSKTVMKGASVRMPLDSSIKITLDRFTMPMEEQQTEDGRMRMAAMLLIDRGGSGSDSTNTLKVRTAIGQGENGPTFEPEWTSIPGTTYGIGLTKVIRNNEDPNRSSAEFGFRDMTKPLQVPREVFVVDFSEKPWISLVWAGVLTMVLGFAFSIGRYARLAAASAQPRKEDLSSASSVEPATQAPIEQGTSTL